MPIRTAPTREARATAREVAFAADTVRAAGRLLLDLRMQSESGQAPGGGKLGRLGTTWSALLIQNRLRARYPDDAVLFAGPVEPLGAGRVWLVSALESERRFGLPGDPDWAVHLALCEAGTVIAAATAVPALAAVATTVDRSPLWRRIPPAPRRRSRLLVGADRPPAFAGPVARQLGAQTLPVGSAGAGVLAVINGEAEGFAQTLDRDDPGTLAVTAVAAAAGLQVTDQGPLLLVARPQFAEPLRAAFAACLTGGPH